MRFRCLISYRVASGQILSWRGTGQGADHAVVAKDMIQRLRRTKRRPIKIIGVTVHDPDAAEEGR